MENHRPIEIAAIVGILLVGAGLFVWAILLSDAVPTEYRSASPGYNWGWSFDYETAMQNAGRLGEQPFPWPAREIANGLLLPLDQPLLSQGLKLTYRGMTDNGNFRLDIVIQGLDAGVTYAQDFDVAEARLGFMIADRRFTLEKITPRYLRLHPAD
ncbi:hypothetical protein [uncultured Desulfosarcina sp.]|uniref:hypothetical protein n=1 Tax=uncultured Desulfosarcina sp. TaxID=218289 RepID=UPI0029C700F1|nr:hypothetical protein [uncultured Desulfosarcina sp.]